MSARDWARSLAGTSAPTETRAISFQDVWGSGGDWHSGATTSAVTLEAALSLPALWSVVDLIAGQISAMPLQTFRKVGGTRERVEDGPLITAPSTTWSPDEWVYCAVASMLLFGDAIGLVTRVGPDGWPAEAEWLDPRTVRVEKTGAALTYSINEERLPAGRVIHIRHGVLLPGALRGRSPLCDLRNPLKTGIEALLYGVEWFRAGGHPSGVLSVDVPELQEIQAKTIVDRFVRATRDRKPVALSKIIDYHAIQSTPEASGLEAALSRTATDIAVAYHVPAEFIGGIKGSSLTYSTLETDQAALDVRALMPVYTRLERALSRWMAPTAYVRFNADSAIRTDIRTRAEVGEILARSGQRTIDELRAKDELPPLGAGDDVDLTRKLQQIYLAVGSVITSDEAREILNREGAGLPVPGPFGGPSEP